MQTKVEFISDGLRLSGILHVPDAARGPRPGVIVTHGFGGTKDGTHEIEAKLYESWGYVVLRFDYRGCGESEGERGRILCHDQVADNRNALSWLAARPEVIPGQIVMSGQSFGAAVNIFTGGVDGRVAGVVSIGGWGDGLEKSRKQHPTPEAWAKFEGLMQAGRQHRETTGTSLVVSRFDIVPIPEHLRGNLPKGSIMEFPAETLMSICAFRPKDVVAMIAPRPLLLIHAAPDSVTPTEQSVDLFRHAGRNADAVFLSGMDHFPFANESSRVMHILKDWMDLHFPLPAGA